VVSNAAMPTDPTALPPPGIATSAASVPMVMVTASGVEYDRSPPKARKQHRRWKPNSRLTAMLPPTISASWRKVRSTVQIVLAASATGGSTVWRSRGGPKISAVPTPRTTTPTTTVSQSR
jgi:hypothetical protein